MTYQSPQSPQFDPYRGGTTGAATGRSGSIGRYVRKLLLWAVLGWAYLYPETVASLLGIEPPGPETDEFVRTNVLMIGGFLLLVTVIVAIVRTRRARREGIPKL